MPLAYLVETTGGVRVVDMTTNHVLAQTTAAGRSIVSIDQLNGVSIGGTIFAPGPLPADHRYAVYVDNGGFSPEEDIRTSNERTDPEILRKHNQTNGDSSASNKPDNKPGGSTTGPSPYP